MKDDKPESTHESYGLLTIHRTHGGESPLFGSSIKHSEKISLTVYRAASYRSLNRTWYGQREQLLEVDMSPAQFAEAITSFNKGGGVPCTIAYVNRKKMEDCPFKDERETVKDEFAETLAGITAKLEDDIKAIQAILDKQGTVTKGDRAAIAGSLNRLKMELSCNIPFVHSSFDEAVEKTVNAAKAEVDAFILHTTMQAGTTALEESRLRLEDKGGEAS